MSALGRLRRQGVPAGATLAAAVAAFVAAAWLAGPAPVEAHSASTYYPKKWTADPYYGLGHLDAPLDTSTAKSSIHAGDNPWDGLAGNWLDFLWSGNENPMVMWTGSGCTTPPSDGLWIVSDDISSLAFEATCTSGDRIVRTAIVFDDTGTSWYTGSSTSVPSGKYDLRSVAVHEFGHAEGFAGHFSSTDTDCSGSDRNTMCSGLPSGTSYKRTLESHDIHTVEAAY